MMTFGLLASHISQSYLDQIEEHVKNRDGCNVVNDLLTPKALKVTIISIICTLFVARNIYMEWKVFKVLSP